MLLRFWTRKVLRGAVYPFVLLLFLQTENAKGVLGSSFIQNGQTILQSGNSQLSANDQDYSSLAFRPVVNVFVSPHVSVEGGYFLLTEIEDGSTLLNGFDIGARYYIWNPGTDLRYEIPDQAVVTSWSVFRTYLLTSFRSRSLNLGQKTVGYSGYGLGLGLEWHFGDHPPEEIWDGIFATFEVSREQLSVTGATSLAVQTYSFGLGSPL